MKYMQTNCDQINQVYKPEQLLSHSVNYWLDYYAENQTKTKKVAGILDCFCQAQLQTQGKDLYSMQFTSGQHTVAVCDEWLVDTSKSVMLSFYLGIVIQAINHVCSYIVSHAVSHVKHANRSDKSTAMMLTQFVI